MSHTTHPGLDALWLTEAVRLREEQAGPLEDSEAVRQALAQGGSLPRRILTRAHWLGRREGLLDAQRTWRQGSRLAAAPWHCSANSPAAPPAPASGCSSSARRSARQRPPG
ncbi:hypothetical protein K652_31232 [Pseudomonas aeruginosa VRFPA02]|nr:hypothetical protein K652_31232 [Pseudomonas aeruginosa VRFPA02]